MTRKQERRRRLERRFVIEHKQCTLPGGLERSTFKEILDAEAKKPLRGGDAPLTYSGLFGESHHQQELFKS